MRRVHRYISYICFIINWIAIICQTDQTNLDYYTFRHTVAAGLKEVLRECSELYKYEPWNCPHGLFLDVLRRKQLPANKESGLVRAFTAASIVLAITRQCESGSGISCECNLDHLRPPVINSDFEEAKFGKEITFMRNRTEEEQISKQFAWQGCDDRLLIAFDVARMYLDSQEVDMDPAIMDPTTKLINSHNYKAGRLAIKRNAKRICKCHGMSGTCQLLSCWIGLPSLRQVGDYLRRQHRTAIKVGAPSASETDPVQLGKELSRTKPTKLVFVDPSPDYCYENTQAGINGTLGRYCKPGQQQNSCDRLCTRCGYRIKRETIQVERQCDCRFKYCCTVECKKCLTNEVVYKCAKHGQ